jgi:TetR/AcrR family transcriptional regulator
VERRGRGRPTASDPTTLSTEHLLDVALEAFAELGYEGTSVREIARKLGVSHNLIPQRIGAKDELWRKSVDQGFGRLMLDILAALSGEDLPDDVERLRAVVTKFVEANTSRPALVRIIAKEAVIAGPRFDYLFENYIEPVRVMGAELLDRLHATGRLRTSSVSLLYFFMTHGAGGPAALPGLAQRFGSSVDPDDPEAVRRHAEESVELIFRGLLDG